jgi:hypothetical protein
LLKNGNSNGQKPCIQEWLRLTRHNFYSAVAFRLTTTTLRDQTMRTRLVSTGRSTSWFLSFSRLLRTLATTPKETFHITTGLIQMCTADKFYGMSMSSLLLVMVTMLWLPVQCVLSFFITTSWILQQHHSDSNPFAPIWQEEERQPASFMESIHEHDRSCPKETYCCACQTGYYQVSATQLIQESIKRCPKQSWQCCHSW